MLIIGETVSRGERGSIGAFSTICSIICERKTALTKPKPSLLIFLKKEKKLKTVNEAHCQTGQ